MMRRRILGLLLRCFRRMKGRWKGESGKGSDGFLGSLGPSYTTAFGICFVRYLCLYGFFLQGSSTCLAALRLFCAAPMFVSLHSRLVISALELFRHGTLEGKHRFCIEEVSLSDLYHGALMYNNDLNKALPFLTCNDTKFSDNISIHSCRR